MSIQGQITRVSGEVAAQADLLGQISSALDGKAMTAGAKVAAGSYIGTGKNPNTLNLEGNPKFLFITLKQATTNLSGNTQQYQLITTYGTTRAITFYYNGTESNGGVVLTWGDKTLTITSEDTNTPNLFALNRAGAEYLYFYVY